MQRGAGGTSETDREPLGVEQLEPVVRRAPYAGWVAASSLSVPPSLNVGGRRVLAGLALAAGDRDLLDDLCDRPTRHDLMREPMTILDCLRACHPELAGVVFTGVESCHGLQVGELVCATAPVIAIHTSDFEEDESAQARLEADGRDLLRPADRSRSELLRWRLASVRRAWAEAAASSPVMQGSRDLRSGLAARRSCGRAAGASVRGVTVVLSTYRELRRLGWTHAEAIFGRHRHGAEPSRGRLPRRHGTGARLGGIPAAGPEAKILAATRRREGSSGGAGQGGTGLNIRSSGRGAVSAFRVL
jgi:hypothetical protein